MSTRFLFLSSVLASTVLFLVYFSLTRQVRTVLDLQRIGQDIYVNGQIGVEDVESLARQEFRTIVDLRPDGENAAQTPSRDIERTARADGMAFRYLPVRHGEVPADAVVAQLTDIMRSAERPVLLYCRTGNRALRTYVLVLASDPDGPDQADIMALAHNAGHGVEDLRVEIQGRIARRSAPIGAVP